MWTFFNWAIYRDGLLSLLVLDIRIIDYLGLLVIYKK
jgi:hypothetical protein